MRLRYAGTCRGCGIDLLAKTEAIYERSSKTVRCLADEAPAHQAPGTCANIDRIAVTPTGVYVIDAKRYKGRPQLKIEGGFLRPRVERRVVGTRDCSKLVDGVLKAGGRWPRDRR